MASKHGWLEVAKLLVEKGAVVNAKNKDGRTPLHVALKYSWTEVEAVEVALRWVT
jgi:ankyrin repeat protein